MYSTCIFISHGNMQVSNCKILEYISSNTTCTCNPTLIEDVGFVQVQYDSRQMQCNTKCICNYWTLITTAALCCWLQVLHLYGDQCKHTRSHMYHGTGLVLLLVMAQICIAGCVYVYMYNLQRGRFSVELITLYKHACTRLWKWMR